jgi:DNA (cytosine-5)-methyltransferase 1
VAEVNKYLTILESAWQEHLAEREPNAPTVISTFAGCGGSSLGYSMAGFRELLANEWDDNAVATFKLNFPDVPVIQGDIAKLTVEQVLELTGLQPGELDVFDGSPPCQGFSTAGKRIIDDPRNQLFREYVRLLRGLQPKVFVMENVSGMVKGKMKLIFADILRELKASGYKVSARLLNAMYFNVPQSRQRLIFIGVREDLGIEPSHPKAESRPFTVRDAWLNVDNKTFCKDIAGYWQEKIYPLIQPGKNGYMGKYFNTYRLGWNCPSPTLCKSTSYAGFAGAVHPEENRSITIDEAKRIGSFPDEFQFIGDYPNQWMRIGNSVPPLFMRSIARHIRSEILGS